MSEGTMSQRISLLAPVAVAAALVAGCAAKETKWPKEAARLVVYSTQVPLYPGAELEDAMGSESWGDTEDSYSEGMAVWFTVKDPKEKVLAWYDGKLPDAPKSIEADGDVTYKLNPAGAEAGEDMGVTVGDGKIMVTESTKRGKHKDT